MLVFGLWWARNSSIFSNEDIPPVITASLNSKLSKEFMVEPKDKSPRLPAMLGLD